MLAGVVGVALAVAARAEDAPKAFADPKPPEVYALPDVPPSDAKENPDATFRAAPKPLPAGAKTSDWTDFLGPHHNLVCDETGISHELPPNGPPVVWEMKKGSGFSAPAVLGERLVLFHRVGDEEVIDCLQATTGKRFWRYAYPTNYADRYGYNDGPRTSPVIGTATARDGKREYVYAIGAEGKLHCVELQTGQLRWERDLAREFKVPQNFFGWGAGPLVEGDKLIVNVGARKGPSVAAFDLDTGKMVWGAGDEWGPSYATPVPATVHGKRRVFVFAGGESDPPTGGLICLDPSNGQIDFAFPWRGNRAESVNASSPLVVGDKVLVSESYGSGGALVQVLPPEGEGKPLGHKVLWQNAGFGTHFMTAVEHQGHLYGVDGHGPNDAFLVCVNIETGQEVWRTQPEWREQVTSKSGAVRQLTMGTYRAWLMPVGGKFLMQGEFGHLLWVDLTPQGIKALSRAWLFPASETWTPPVLSRGLLYVAQNTPAPGGPPARLVCYDLRAGGLSGIGQTTQPAGRQ